MKRKMAKTICTARFRRRARKASLRFLLIASESSLTLSNSSSSSLLASASSGPATKDFANVEKFPANLDVKAPAKSPSDNVHMQLNDDDGGGSNDDDDAKKCWCINCT